MKKILVTGANGFIGTGLCNRLVSKGVEVTAAMRRPERPFFDQHIKTVNVGNIGARTEWADTVANIDVVVHLAARVHVMKDEATNPLDAYRQVNVEGTARLAKQAANAGVKRFVYLSSIKVNGEENTVAYKEKDKPFPEDVYGISKFEAEEQLNAIEESSGMELVIIRPPLVYGPSVKANFLALMRLVSLKIPLPMAGIHNKRSYIFIDNLIDCIITCMTHPAAAGQTYLVSDDNDVSTPDLIRLMATALNVPCFLFPVPEKLLRLSGCVFGKTEATKRLLGSLTADISKIKEELSWKPPFSIESGLRATSDWFKKNSV